MNSCKCEGCSPSTLTLCYYIRWRVGKDKIKLLLICRYTKGENTNSADRVVYLIFQLRLHFICDLLEIFGKHCIFVVEHVRENVAKSLLRIFPALGAFCVDRAYATI